MVSERRPFGYLLLGVLIFFLFPACDRPSEPVADLIYVLTGDGAFSPVKNFQDGPDPGVLPWPGQIRVTDILSRGGRAYLAVNGCGIATAEKTDRGIALVPCYTPAYFSGRTLTRLFPMTDGLACHVYYDSSFPESRQGVAPAARIGLLRITAGDSGLDYAPLPLLFQKEYEPWEAVGAGALAPDTLILEWRLTEREQTRFRYSTYRLSDGGEEERGREWFYAHAALVRSPAAEGEPVPAALMQSVAGRLAGETPGCQILFTVFDASGGADERYMFRDGKARDKRVSVYYDVRLVRMTGVCSLLLGDGRFILARSAEPAAWREDRLPGLPSGSRYTALGVCADFLCAAWEQVDFYRVGRAGIVVRPGNFRNL
jgi:hypothetical protein